MPQSEKTAVKMNTEEALRKLFPKRVIERAKQVAAESDTRTEPPNESSTESDASGN